MQALYQLCDAEAKADIWFPFGAFAAMYLQIYFARSVSVHH